MLIRRAIGAELPAVVDLVNSAYRGEAAQKGWTSEAGFLAGQRTDLASLKAELESHDARQVLTLREERGGPLIGCCLLDRVDDETLYLGMLSVSPDAQNKGVGKRLVAAAETYARETGAKYVRITVIQVREALLAWYERHGFVRTGETEPFPYGDERFGIPLRPDLHFVVLEKQVV